MAHTIRLPASETDIRAQLHANLNALQLAAPHSLEVIVARGLGGGLLAWVITGARKAIIKGPACSTVGEALEALLKATAQMVTQKFEAELEEFGDQLSTKVEGAFVLDSVLEAPLSSDKVIDDGVVGKEIRVESKRTVQNEESSIRSKPDGTKMMLRTA